MSKPITLVYGQATGWVYANGIPLVRYPCAFGRTFLFGRVVRKDTTKTYWLVPKRRTGALRVQVTPVANGDMHLALCRNRRRLGRHVSSVVAAHLSLDAPGTYYLVAL